MCVNCGVQGCGCNPAHIQIPIGPQGPTGMTGPIGPPGQNGTNGRSIVNSNYDPTTGIVTFYYSDNTSSVTGDLRGADGSSGSGGGSSAGSAIIDEFNNQTFNNFSLFQNSSLAQWRAQMHPIGLISMFAASTVNFTNGYGIDLSGGSNLLGWAICNGGSYNKSVTGLPGGDIIIAPDLTGKFVVGVDGSTFTVGSQGGSIDHHHDIDPLSTNQIPKHKHGVSNVSVSPHKHPAGTLETDIEPDHKHALYVHDNISSGKRVAQADSADGFEAVEDDSRGAAGAHSHAITGSTDFQTGNVTLTGLTDDNTSTQSGITTRDSNNLPPYYSIIYLIKI